jgi:hypothetical protein
MKKAINVLYYDVSLLTLKEAMSGTRVDLVLFVGGEDVDPAIYGEHRGQYTSINSARDKYESDIYHSIPYFVAKLGICRGAQFLTVMNRGKLIQHVENHGIGGMHPIDIVGPHPYGGGVKEITSTHHQMLYPFNLKKDEEYVMCAYSSKFLSGTYLNGDNKEIHLPNDFVEPEIVFYPKSNSLCIQGHPESSVLNQEQKQWFLKYIDTILKL